MTYVILAQAELPKDLTNIEVLAICDTKEQLDEFYKQNSQELLYLEFLDKITLDAYQIQTSDGKRYYNFARLSEVCNEPIWPKSYNLVPPQHSR